MPSNQKAFKSRHGLDTNGATLTSLPTPSALSDAATKGYVDAAVAAPIAITDLSDVTITTPTTGQALEYNGSYWVNATPTGGSGGGSSTLNGLIDVALTGLAVGQQLQWGGSNWVNVTPAVPTNTFDIYFNNLVPFAAVGGNEATGTDLIFDAAGNGYWAVANQQFWDGVTQLWTLPSYIYKITPTGAVSIYATVNTSTTFDTALAIDGAGVIYWAVTNSTDGVGNFDLNSYVYKIVAGAPVEVASTPTSNAHGTALVFDSAGTLWWSIGGAVDPGTVQLFSIDTTTNVKTLVSSQTTYQSAHSALAADTSGNVYWSVTNLASGTNYNQFQNLYKVTSGTASTLATFAMNGGTGTDVKVDTNGDVYWAVAGNTDGTTGNVNSYLMKVVGMTLTTISTYQGGGSQGTSIALGNNHVYWTVANNAPFIPSNLFRVNKDGSGTVTMLVDNAPQINYAYSTKLAFDNNRNLYWVVTYQYDLNYNYRLNSIIHVLVKQ